MKPCFHCYAKFKLDRPKWCDCVRPMRTLVCPECHSCFCTVPLSYKRAFWTDAPRALREAPQRFAHDTGRTPHARSTLTAPVVLIVDDDEAIRSLIAFRLRELGYRAVTTGDPHHALMMARSRDVAVVLTDALMPYMDGRELCRTLKATEEGSGKKTIVMTSLYKARKYADEAMLHYHADAYITKPIDFSRLGDLLADFAPLVHGEAMAS
jgi:CheY-like chemotaxis protein